MCPHTKYLYTGHIFTVHPGGGGREQGGRGLSVLLYILLFTSPMCSCQQSKKTPNKARDGPTPCLDLAKSDLNSYFT